MEPLFKKQNNYSYIIFIPVTTEFTAANPQKEIIKAEARSYETSWFKKYLLEYINHQKNNLKELEKAFDEALLKI